MAFHRDIIRAAAPLVKAFHRLEVIGRDNIPPPGQGFLLAPNHTHWFGWDGFVLNTALADRPIRWIAWSYGDEFPLWDKLCAAFDAILVSKNKPFPYDEITDYIKSGGAAGIFPEGNNNSIATPYRIRRFFPGVARLAALSGAPVVPVSVAGIEEAGPILWIKEEEGQPPTWLLPAPVLLPVKVTVRFGAPMRLNLSEADIQNREALDREAERVRQGVLELLRKDRPRATAP
jgi:1-acyl-sn-glycerol-3-phosphate acyltransferase